MPRRGTEFTITHASTRDELAEVLELLKAAARSTRSAHALACRRRRSHKPGPTEAINQLQWEALDVAVKRTWDAEEAAREALMDTGAASLLFRGRRSVS